jgi:hypothetical protein
MLIRHHNFTLDGSDIPVAVGDRYYAQDIERDFYNQREYSGRISEDYLGLYDRYSGNIVINGLTCSQGAGHTLSWTAGRVKVSHTLKTPTDWSALPPAMTSHTIPHNIDILAATDQAITSATTDGITVNYAKISLNESGTSTRTRAKKAGTYSSEVSESYTFTCNSTVPAANEVAIATFTSNGAALTFTNDEPRWRKIKAVTAVYTVKTYDFYVTGSGTFDLDLPAVVSAKGQYVCLDNIGTGTLTADPNGAETIEGYSSIDIYPQKKLILYCDGTVWQIINDFEIIKSIGADYTITDSDIYKKYHFAHSASTGLLQGNLPTLADNIGKRYEFQNTGLGLSYINSEEGGNILFKDNSVDKLLLLKKGDKATLLATSAGWLVEDYYMCIESGWYNRSEERGVHIGFANYDYDNQSDSSDRTGFKYVLDSGVTGLCIADSAPSGNSGTYTVCFVTGTGLAINNEEVTFGDAVTADVNEGSGNNKNQDWNITHNMGCQPSSWRMYYNATATYTGAWLYDMHIGESSSRGLQVLIIDDDEYKIQTLSLGFLQVTDASSVGSIGLSDAYFQTITEFSA